MVAIRSKDIPQLWTAISHEIRTPLNVIKGMTNLSENELYDTEMVKDCLMKIKDSTENMQMVVNSLVDYAAITGRKLEIQNAKVDFKNLITDIAMRSYLASKEKNCHFNMHVQEVTEETLLTDEARLSQIIVTMLNLVIRYTNPNGIVDFSVRQMGLTSDEVFMRFSLRSTALQFPDDIVKYVNDNSLYMNPDLLQPIGPMGLVEMNTLYISYLMGGKITATNNPGDYSEIVFDMKFGRLNQQESSLGAKLFADQRILIVADDEATANERGRMLKDMSVYYDIACEIDEALEKIGDAEDKGKPFTITIIDWELQDNTCLALIREIRQIFGSKMVILASAHDPESHSSEAAFYGANYVIDRTIFRSTLFDALVGIEKGIQIRKNGVAKKKYDFTGKRILIAEDVALNMEVITKLLTRVNVEVACTENGKDAVEQFVDKPAGYYDAILLDINMPIMDGYTAAEQVRASQKADAKTIKIFAMTANAFKEDIEAAMEAGMDGHIAKPIDVEILYSTLQHALFASEQEYEKTLQKRADALRQENEQLKEWAQHDPLTGCLNRRGLEGQLEQLKENEGPLACLELDLDDFKHINDRFGHDIGDKILVKTVNLIKRNFRSTDYVVRLGGDEFLVILANFSKNSKYIEQRVHEMNDDLLHPRDGLPPISISVGGYISDLGYTDEVLHKADVGLYKAKNTGKAKFFLYKDVNGEEDSPRPLHYEYATHMEDLFYFDDQIKVLVDHKEEYRSLLMTANNPVGFITGFGEPSLPIYSFSGFFLDHLGYTIEEFRAATRHGFADFINPKDVEYLMTNREQEKLQSAKIRIRHKNGDFLWYDAKYLYTKTDENRVFWMCSLRLLGDDYIGMFCSDDYRFVALLDPEKDLVVLEKGVFLASDHELHTQKPYIYSTLVNQAISDVVKEDDRRTYLEKADLANIKTRLYANGLYEFTVFQKWNDNEYAAVRHKYRTLPDRPDTILITWEILNQWAEMDELTDCMNEAGFYRAAEEIIQREFAQTKFSILYFNIADFKGWNSLLGKDNADQLLKQVAARINHCGLSPLMTARLFADNFVTLVETKNISDDTLMRLCASDYEFGSHEITVRMRCGIFHVNGVHESVRRMCDKAKLAKTNIDNEHAVPYRAFDESLNEEYMQHLQVLNNVGSALEKKQIKVFYQPIVDAKTGEIHSAEALIRWQLSANRLMAPGIFIPVLEEQGLISEVDSYAQDTVMKLLKSRNAGKKPIVPVSVNMSRMDFMNAKFTQHLKDLIEREDLTDYLHMEVTESAFIEVGKTGQELLNYLKENHIDVLMDDFGTGFSSFSGLTGKQFDIIKMDMSLIAEIGKGNGAEQIVKAVVDMCHTLGLKVVAEGVETRTQAEFLKNADCDYLQGYYFYKPMREEDFEELLNNGGNHE